MAKEGRRVQTDASWRTTINALLNRVVLNFEHTELQLQQIAKRRTGYFAHWHGMPPLLSMAVKSRFTFIA